MPTKSMLNNILEVGWKYRRENTSIRHPVNKNYSFPHDWTDLLTNMKEG